METVVTVGGGGASRALTNAEDVASLAPVVADGEALPAPAVDDVEGEAPLAVDVVGAPPVVDHVETPLAVGGSEDNEASLVVDEGKVLQAVDGNEDDEASLVVYGCEAPLKTRLRASLPPPPETRAS